MAVSDWVFLIAASASAAGGVLAVTRRNPLYSAMCLLLTLVGMAVIFYLLSATFLAMMQVLVYVGAILVLFLFVIMLLNLRPEELQAEAPLKERVLAVALALALLVLLAVAILRPAGDPWTVLALPASGGGTAAGGGSAVTFGTIEGVGRSLFTRYVLPFEFISLLIVVAMVAAVVLAKKKL